MCSIEDSITGNDEWDMQGKSNYKMTKFEEKSNQIIHMLVAA